jgi:hypothetical protein
METATVTRDHQFHTSAFNARHATAARARERLAALLSVCGVVAFAVLVIVLHFLEPELDPSWRFISEYSIGRYGGVMMLAFFSWATSITALFVALRREVASRGGRVGARLLLLVGLSLIVAGLFAQDPVTAKPDELTTHGTLHAIASMIGIPGIPIAALLISWSLSRHNPNWSSERRPLMWTAHLTWISLLTMIVYLGLSVPQAGGFGPTIMAGWMNRLVVASYCLWQVAVSWRALQPQRESL